MGDLVVFADLIDLVARVGIIVLVCGGIVGIVFLICRMAGITIRPELITIFWIVILILVGIGAIYLLVQFAHGGGGVF